MAEDFTSLFLQTKQHNSIICEQKPQKCLKSFKPWVFKPKKVKYSLQQTLPKKKVFSTSHWNSEQNACYVQFLLKFQQILNGEKQKKRKWHLNRILSKMVGTRSHEQCRSHHQKMMKHHKSINSIIDYLTQGKKMTPPQSVITGDDNQKSQILFDDIFMLNDDLFVPELPMPIYQNDESDYI